MGHIAKLSHIGLNLEIFVLNMNLIPLCGPNLLMTLQYVRKLSYKSKFPGSVVLEKIFDNFFLYEHPLQTLVLTNLILHYV
jgi:hypothetical protein